MAIINEIVLFNNVEDQIIPQIDNEIIKDFNLKINKLKQEISTISPPKMMTIDNFYSIVSRQLNYLEIARRIFNEYAESGEVKIPD